MRRKQRGPWIVVDPNYILCNFCRYANHTEDDCYCEHPLDVVNEPGSWDGIEPGGDCWGFRPRKGLTVEAAREWVAANKGEGGEER